MTAEKPLRVLHVIGGMVRGGIETWLMHVLRQIDREHFQMDFLVHTAEPCAYDEEIRTLGGKILPCLDHRRPLLYARNFRNILREFGPYDVVHSHVHNFSGFVLRLASQEGVPVRIAHCHTDTSARDSRAGLLRRAYLTLMKRWIRRHATGGLAASRQAAAALYGPAWEADPRWRLFYCGIDLAPFWSPADPEAIRAEFGIPPGSLVVGHVGRFCEAKNHAFLVRIAAEVIKRHPESFFLLVGDGELRASIECQAIEAGLAGQVIFAGDRSDVPRLMQGAMDAFVLPSLYEGLPVVGIEAQAAGLPCFISDTVTPEVNIVPGMVRRLSLSQPAAAWAEAVLAVWQEASGLEARDVLPIIGQSQFNITKGLEALELTYAAASK